ncbi:MAG TPA: quinone-dependent dihydroorotate dehydrogenase [Rhodospirillales bacterium]|jgi:dihydroorotate dehydrogenase|nr:quinone-dependent dihydroorotate dehydrogenase [Rhodospirillales bacterium]HJO69495.1 quinone-dependent dihydroorotate dehydrogenase [Rhodospirillales bacterium]
MSPPSGAVWAYRAFAWPFLRLLDPETAHEAAIRALRWGLVPRPRPRTYGVLGCTLWGLEFESPVGLAAGFDKDAQVVDAMLARNFGFVEVGTVTPRPQKGNPRPRVFRLTRDGAAINRLGFNNTGSQAVAARLGARRRAGIVGVNIGRNAEIADAVADYRAGARCFAHLADYLAINVSSPNTPGLRALQTRDALEELLRAVRDTLEREGRAGALPLLLKIAPDLDAEELDDVADVALAQGIDGIIATNTTLARPDSLVEQRRDEAGGLSGRPLFAPSTAVLAGMYRRTGGKVPLIGVGGIETGRDAYLKIRAGASLVQLYTGMIYHGPGLVASITGELAALVEADGFANVADAVGADHRS